MLLRILIIFLAINPSQLAAMKVKIAHIGAINVMPKSEAILDICRKELWKEGILSDDFDIE
jgi:hypothetical protein